MATGLCGVRGLFVLSAVVMVTSCAQGHVRNQPHHMEEWIAWGRQEKRSHVEETAFVQVLFCKNDCNSLYNNHKCFAYLITIDLILLYK